MTRWNEPTKRTGVILAGGYSTRFGEDDKALARLDNQPLLVHAVNGLAPAVDAVLVNCRREQLPEFRRVLASESTKIAFVCDPEPDAGPAAGLGIALDAVTTPFVAVLACDMPFVDAEFLDWLFGEIDDAEGAIPYVDGVPQPTHAVFQSEPTRRAVADAVLNASGSLRDVLDRLTLVEIPETQVLDRTAQTTFVDVNTPADLAALPTSDTVSMNAN